MQDYEIVSKIEELLTRIEAQRMKFVEAAANNTQANKIFVVPLAINYHFVLEANSLIDEHLKRSGKERLTDKDPAPKNELKRGDHVGTLRSYDVYFD